MVVKLFCYDGHDSWFPSIYCRSAGAITWVHIAITKQRLQRPLMPSGIHCNLRADGQ